MAKTLAELQAEIDAAVRQQIADFKAQAQAEAEAEAEA
jgi:hypothetical protein